MSMENNYWVKNKKRALKGFDKHIVVFTSSMNTYPSPISEKEFVDRARERFLALLPGLPLHACSEKHLFNELMPALATISAAYLVLREHGYNVDQVGRLEYEGYLQMFNKIPGFVRRVAKHFIVSPLYKKAMQKGVDKMTAGGGEDTFFIDLSFDKKPVGQTTMNCTRCAMITFFEKNDLKELKRICNVFDFAQAESFGLGLRQPGCIGRDDDVCTYVFTKDRNDTVHPSSIAEIITTPMEINM